MFTRSFRSKDRVSKPTREKRSFTRSKQQLFERLDIERREKPKPLAGVVFSIAIGRGENCKMFAAHEEYLWPSPFFAAAMKEIFYTGAKKRIDLPDEEAEVFSCILEYLYKTDYHPFLLSDERKSIWYLEGTRGLPPHKGGPDPLMYHKRVDGTMLRETAVYCAAEKYGLVELKRLALRKQGLHTGVGVGAVVRSAKYAYANTPECDTAIRAHFISMIIRNRKTFMRSGTMQAEVELGGRLWWDLLLSMSEHMDPAGRGGSLIGTPRTI